MTRRPPGFARAFAGRWRITEMDQWEDLDLLEPAHITFIGIEVQRGADHCDPAGAGGKGEDR
jgi:hypothetical protein